MKQIMISAGLLAMLSLASCSSETAQDNTTQEQSLQTTEATTAIPADQPTTEVDPAALAASQEPQQPQQPQQITVNQAPAAQGNVKLNPPHGQPGHDCAIAVGAPLGSAPAQQAQPQSAATPGSPFAQPAAQPAAAPAAKPGARLNPPHGQPGHDCAVAVGAPLP